MDVGTRTLRYFVAVAEELSFTRAAERLFVSQPAISRAIRHLENELREPLFTREPEVGLTPAGRSMLDSARKLIADWETMHTAARAAGSRATTVLRLGFVATGAGRLGTRARAVFSERCPGATVEAKRLDWGGEAAALRKGEVDVAFIWQPADLTGLSTRTVATQRRMVGVAATHRLANRRSVVLADLRGEPIPRARRASEEWVDWWGVFPRPDGSEPVWGPANDNVEELLEQVAADQGVCIVPSSIAEFYARPDVVWRPLLDAEPTSVAVGWQTATANAAVLEFVAVVAELAGVSPVADSPEPGITRIGPRASAESLAG
ncbi:LysR family transcriptional regulator [Actinosynnema sp. NPDC091369]